MSSLAIFFTHQKKDHLREQQEDPAPLDRLPKAEATDGFVYAVRPREHANASGACKRNLLLHTVALLSRAERTAPGARRYSQRIALHQCGHIQPGPEDSHEFT